MRYFDSKLKTRTSSWKRNHEPRPKRFRQYIHMDRVAVDFVPGANVVFSSTVDPFSCGDSSGTRSSVPSDSFTELVSVLFDNQHRGVPRWSFNDTRFVGVERSTGRKWGGGVARGRATSVLTPP